MTVSFQLIAPGRSWLHTQPQRDRDRVARQEIRRQAVRALAEIDQAVKAHRARSIGSRCGRCRSPIATTATWCPTCHLDYITGEYHADNAAVWTRAARDAAEYKLDRVYQFGETPIEFSHHIGPILEVR